MGNMWRKTEKPQGFDHAHPAVLVFRVGGRDSGGQKLWASEFTIKRMVLKNPNKIPSGKLT
jgi:hypothetical protein